MMSNICTSRTNIAKNIIILIVHLYRRFFSLSFLFYSFLFSLRRQSSSSLYFLTMQCSYTTRQHCAVTCTSIAEFYFQSAHHHRAAATKVKVPRNRIMKCSEVAFHRCLQPVNTRYFLLPPSFSDFWHWFC